MKKLLIGTSNPAKLETYKILLKDFNFELVTSKDLNIPAPEETGASLEDVAVAKAKYYFEKSGLPSLVDDGGMEIQALNGEPGVKSHRWIGRQMKDHEIVAEVMNRMKDVPKDQRHCRFRVVLALATEVGIFTSEAEVVGVVSEEPSKQMVKGYPYDAVLFLPNYGKFVCELSETDYEIMNHRRHAMEKLHDILIDLSK